MMILIFGIIILLFGPGEASVTPEATAAHDAVKTASIDVFKIVAFCFFIFAAVVAFVWACAAELLISRFPSVKNFHSTRERLAKLHIKKTLKQAYEVDEIAQLRFEELSQSGNDQNILNEVRHKRFGDVITIVSHKERDLHHLTREMRIYSGVFLALLMYGILTNADKFTGKSFSEVSEAFFSYHVIPLLEVIMIVYLIMRFVIEMQSINSLVKE